MKIHSKYQILETDIELLWEFQGGLCPICKKMLNRYATGMNVPCIDHDHKTGAVRGIIHSRCNLLLGYARDDEKTLANAIAYLKDTPAAVFFSQEECLDY